MGGKKKKPVPHLGPSATEDAKSLWKAFEGPERNEKPVISILAHRKAGERRRIREAYRDIFKGSLIDRLRSALEGHFQKAVYRWMCEPIEREAIFAYTEVRNDNCHPDLRVIVEIACVGSPNELLKVKKAYQLRYKHSLEEDVATRTTGDVRKLLVALVGTYRYDGNEIDTGLAAKEAKVIHVAIEKKAFGNEEFIRILTTRSKAQLNATFNRFRDEYNTTINQRLKAYEDNDYNMVLGATIRAISSPLEYFEKLLRTRTDEATLTRVIVGRAEKDLKRIKEVYYKRNNVRLAEAIAKKTSGNYQAFLRALIGN